MLVVGYLLLMGIVRLVRWVAAPAADEVRKVMVVRGGAAH
jgi:hypothetical protein